VLDEFSIASEPGNERLAIQRVTDAVRGLALPARQLERVKTAVGEATMNAIEHGNQLRAHQLVRIRVAVNEGRLRISVSDSGEGQPLSDAQPPDLDAKLAGQESSRGWGLFLIRDMVDELVSSNADGCHTLELLFDLGGTRDA
jgi:anti-sigma regulatory factor (Ser/Thr protein kinase)